MHYEQPTGLIHDACCDFETIETVNKDLYTQLRDLSRSEYFRYWQVDLFRECPFWKEDGSCMNRACAVEELVDEEQHIPLNWRSASLSQVEKVGHNASWTGSVVRRQSIHDMQRANLYS